MWNSWVTLRAKSNFHDSNDISLKNPEDLGFPVKWEYQRGKEANSNDIDLALSQRIECKNKVDELFKKLDFLFYLQHSFISPLPIRGSKKFKPFLYGNHLWEKTTKFPENKGLEHLRPPRLMN